MSWFLIGAWQALLNRLLRPQSDSDAGKTSWIAHVALQYDFACWIFGYFKANKIATNLNKDRYVAGIQDRFKTC